MSEKENLKENLERICRDFSSRYGEDLEECEQLGDVTYEAFCRLRGNLEDTFESFTEAICKNSQE